MDLCESQIAAQMIVKVEAANAVEVQKRAFPEVSARTVQRCFKEQGLLCHIQKSKPYLMEVHKQKWQLWAMQHIEWTVEDWKRVIFLIQVGWASSLDRLWMTTLLRKTSNMVKEI